MRKLEHVFDTEPQTYPSHDGIELLGGQSAQRSHQPNSWYGYDALRIKATGVQKRDGDRDLVSSTTKARGMWHHRDQSAIFIGTRDAEDQARANLCGKTEVDQPDLASARSSQP